MKVALKNILRTLPFVGTRFETAPNNFIFPDAAAHYQNRLTNFWSRESLHISESKDSQIGIVVTPFIFTPAPFFAIELGLQLCAQGKNVVFFWDAKDVFLNAARPREVQAIEATLAQLPRSIKLVDVSQIASFPSVEFPFLLQLIRENAVRHLRGEAQVDLFLNDNAHLKDAMHVHCSRVSRLLTEIPVDLLIIPGGVWASCGIYFECAKASGIPLTTYDSGPGQLFVAQNSVAAHFGDIPVCLQRLLSQASESEIQCALSLAESAISRRMKGDDQFCLQQVSRKTSAKSFIFVPLNLRFDSAALCRHRLFGSVTEWLVQLLNWVKSQPNLSMAIRQHPCERLNEYRGTDNWENILDHFSSLSDRVYFFDAFADVNTYDLIESSRVVLPFTSRVGIEAAMMGKPVVTCTHCYYEHCGFTLEPSTPDAYFETIHKTLFAELDLNRDARKRAQLIYYLMEYCTAVETKFTPHPANYHEWILVAPSTLAKEPQVKTTLAALSAEESLTWLLHKQVIQENL